MALLPPMYLNTVVALGCPGDNQEIKYSATGFLYAYPTGEVDEEGEKTFWTFLVTNRHVFETIFQHSEILSSRFNKLDATGSSAYSVSRKNANWTAHPDPECDVAVLGINPDQLMADNIEHTFFYDDRALTCEQAATLGVSEGDGVFILGFPLGQAGDERNYVIARQGIIGRAQHWLRGNASTFLIDASIFPGNSGGPVLLKPEAVAIRGTKANDKCALIGMVSSYLPYQEVAVSQQTGRPRMIFEENSGLATVVPCDAINEAIQAAIDKIEAKPRRENREA